jgi:hypothetical protein
MKPILVTGPARSGTSMTAGCLNLMGAFAGDCLGPTPENPKGFFENKRIRQTILKPLLSDSGLDPLGQRMDALVGDELIGDPAKIRSDVITALTDQGWDGETPWVYKDAKLALCWPMFMGAFPEAIWVVTSRPAEQIAASCERTWFMSDEVRGDNPDYWLDWAALYQELASDIPDHMEVDTVALAGGDTTQILEVAEAADIDGDMDAMEAFIDGNLFGD